ncbi:porin family protein [Hymenobacter canadensis]|uniref:Outer membrane beta-barrel protein n=1 Tax=Hymenobacter canadensis TaxID=2999067 RepID=A0ABY7LU90_9BACT|nr:outer membrane beta-barrel protein [Hymenobacter canadensis]WBA42458.1 outer membrane beta-barrel protein [Hymenobacter canadensis]
MTERESEELYEELRRKLEGYGSTPPPDMWAAIQRQLPPGAPKGPAQPLPRPALRRRWALALLLLIGVVVVVGVLAIRPASRPEVATLPAAHNEKDVLGRLATAADASQPAATPQPDTHTSSTSQLASPADAAANGRFDAAEAKSAAPAMPEASSGSVAAASAATAAASQWPAAGRPQPAALAGTVTAAAPRRQRTGSRFDSQLLRNTQPLQPAIGSASDAPGQQPARHAGQPAPTSSSGVAARSLAAALLPDSSISSAEAARLLTAAANAPQPATATARMQPDSAENRRLQTDEGQQAVAGSLRSTIPASQGSAGIRQPATDLHLALLFPVGNLLPRAAQVLPFAAALPAVQPVAVAPQVPRPASRWAVELLAGPAISYRRLEASDSASLSTLERPALTFAGQMQVRYTLTPRLSVSAGLGYATYGTRLNLLLQPPRDTSSALRPAQPLQQRDTYRYFTLPLQAQYRLGGQTRLRYGLTAGAALEMYAGGRTSGSTACTCSQQQTWSATNSPYRRLGVSLTAGLDVRYALTPRLHLLLQPTGRYGLVSIVAPGTTAPSPIPPPGGNPLPPTTLPARHPFAAGLLTGFSFDLR